MRSRVSAIGITLRASETRPAWVHGHLHSVGALQSDILLNLGAGGTLVRVLVYRVYRVF